MKDLPLTEKLVCTESVTVADFKAFLWSGKQQRMKKVCTKGNEGASTTEATRDVVAVGGILEHHTTAR